MINRWLILGVAFWALSACATREPSRSESAAADAPTQTAEDQLPAQTLDPGACGLFLWTTDKPSRFVFFMRAGESDAKVQSADGPKDLRLTHQEGTLMGQFATKTVFQTASAEQVLLSFGPGEEIDGGQRIRNGRLVFLGKDNWETIVPVVGLAACQTADVE